MFNQITLNELYFSTESKRRRSDSAPFTAKFEFDIDIIPEMSPLSYILVYLVDDNGELVDDYQEFSVNSCFKNEVSFQYFS